MSRFKLFAGILAVEAVACLLIWRSIRASKVTGTVMIAWCLTALFAGVALKIYSNVPRPLIFLGVIGAAVVVNIANIMFDISRDPTSHNLFPFELVMTLVINFFGVGVGVAIASMAGRKPGSSYRP